MIHDVHDVHNVQEGQLKAYVTTRMQSAGSACRVGKGGSVDEQIW